MFPAPTALSVLRHALADPLSAATVKAEVLSARLRRELPALEARVQDLSADLVSAGRLLDLLGSLAAIGLERRERSSLAQLVAPFGPGAVSGGAEAPLDVRPTAAADAIRQVLAFGGARGGTPRIEARVRAGRAEVLVQGLGPAPGPPLARLFLLPRETPGAEELFVARAALDADGGTIELRERDGGLDAVLSWPVAGGTA